MDPLIQFENVHKKFGNQTVLKDVNFTIPKGKITFIIGRSGEGKSVIIKHMVGIFKPDGGKVFINGEDTAHFDQNKWLNVRKKIGYLFQDGALFDSLSVGENVCFALKEHGDWGPYGNASQQKLRQRGQELLDWVGLPHAFEKSVQELSMGEKKRVGLARALALNPRLLLYDEPTTSMDSFIAQRIDDLIVTMQDRDENISSIVISHDIQSIYTIAEHILFLHQGCIYAHGSLEFFKKSTDKIIRQFFSGLPDNS